MPLSHAPQPMKLSSTLQSFLQAQSIHKCKMLVAVSGGADSMALLFGLHQWSAEFQLEIGVAHFNHLLRGADSDADEALVLSACQELQVPIFVERENIALAAASSRANLEEIARQKRYGYLLNLAQTNQIGWIATAHQQSDQAETILHHLARGTGLHGLRGIAARRTITPGIDLIRPLLSLSREDVMAFIKAHGVPFRDDRTNFDARWTRNRIRHEIMPYLQKQLNRDIIEHLCQWAELANEVQALLHQEVQSYLPQVVKPRAGKTIVLDAAALMKMNKLHQRELLHQVWEAEHWPMGEMTRTHWIKLIDIVHGKQPSADFPGPIHASRRDSMLLLESRILLPDRE